MHKRLVWAALLSACLLACSSTESDWKRAQAQDTIAAYQDFLGKHPSGAHSTEAQSRVAALQDEAAWASAQQTNTAAGYRGYLSSEPNGTHRAQAEASAADADRLAAWQAAQASGTAASLEAFLQKYPQSAEAVQARARLSALTGYTVRLGSRRSSALAERERKHLVAKFGGVLHAVVIVPPSGKRKPYVLESAAMSEQDARSACKTLEKSHQRCAVTKAPSAAVASR